MRENDVGVGMYLDGLAVPPVSNMRGLSASGSDVMLLYRVHADLRPHLIVSHQPAAMHLQ